jgi:hypothetical protein
MRRTRVPYVVFGLIALLLLLLSILLQTKEPTLADMIKDLGIVVAAVVVLELLWNGFGGDPLSQQVSALEGLNESLKGELTRVSAQVSELRDVSDNLGREVKRIGEDLQVASRSLPIEVRRVIDISRYADQNGLIGVYGHASQVDQTEWFARIRGTSRVVDLCGYSLYSITEQRDLLQAIGERVRQGVTVRVLICAPGNPNLQVAGEYPPGVLETMRAQMGRSLTAFLELRADLSESERERLLVHRLENRTMSFSMRRFDGTMYAVPYIAARQTTESPVLVLEGVDKPLFAAYAEAFDRLFRAGVDAAAPVQ